jgi:nitrate reductase cytochrome c-type subunit
MAENEKVMKDIGLNDPVSVTLPAHVWIGFIAAYSSCAWNSGHATQVANAAGKEILHPLWINEQEAQRQQQVDEQQAAFNSLFTGQPPEVPPSMEGLT